VNPTRLNSMSMVPHDRTLPKPAFELTEKKLDPKSAAAKKPVARPRVRKTGAKAKSPATKKLVVKTSAWGSRAAPKTKTGALQKTEAKKPTQSAPSAAAHPAIPKPSAAIAKQQPNTSAN
jgi:hypothetical protein